MPLRQIFYNVKYPLGAAFAWLLTFIGMISGLIQIVQAIDNSQSVREWVAAITLSSITLVTLFVLGYREISHAKASRLAKSLPYLTKTNALLRDLRGFLNVHVGSSKADARQAEETLQRARDMVSELLSMQADAYSTMTGTSCRSCVKLIEVA
jgi:hypothetical protein